MAWVKLDDKFRVHPKILALSPQAGWLWVCAISYSNDHRTDGAVPGRGLSAVAPTVRNPLRYAVELVKAGLWEVAETGWQIHDYHHYQPSAADLMVEDAAKTAAKVAAGQARARLATREQGRFTSRGTSSPPAAHQQATSRATSTPPAGDQQATSPVPVPVPVPEPERRTTKPKAGRNKDSGHVVLTDDQFIASLKANPAYAHLNVDEQSARMDAWLLVNPGRQKTRRFMVNWLNRQDKPLAPSQNGVANQSARTAGNIAAGERVKRFFREREEP